MFPNLFPAQFFVHFQISNGRSSVEISAVESRYGSLSLCAYKNREPRTKKIKLLCIVGTHRHKNKQKSDNTHLHPDVPYNS